MRLPKIQVHPVKALGDIPATSLQNCFDITHRKQERSHPPKMKPAQSPLRASALRTAEQTLPVPPGLPRHTWAFPGPHQTSSSRRGPRARHADLRWLPARPRRACRETTWPPRNGVPVPGTQRKYSKSGTTREIAQLAYGARWQMGHNSPICPSWDPD